MSFRTERHAAFAERRDRLSALLVDGYGDGMSVNALATQFGISRPLATRILEAAGVDLRDRSAALRQRLAALTPDQRRELALPANEARRERGASRRELLQRASTAEQRHHLAALGEIELEGMLRDRGLDPLPQQASDIHNIDLAIPPVAVEVHRRLSHPYRSHDGRLHERALQLVAAGWAVLYVWCAQGVRNGPGQVCFTDRCADEVTAHVERARVDREAVPDLRVLRCTGADVHIATGRGRATNRPDFLDL